VNRAQLLDDSLNLARAGVLPYGTALKLAEYLEKEVDYIPWFSALTAFTFLNIRLTDTDAQSPFEVKQLD
jgi:aminopeptidase N